MKVFKGGYKIVSLLNIDITSDFTISGIYDDIKDSHGKPILVSEINVGGEKMNDAYTIVKQDNTDYIIEVYGYSLTIASDDSVTVASLPEITSIGTGLDLTDGELSATSTGGKVYNHFMRVAKYGGSSITVNFVSSSNTPSTFKDMMEKIRNTTASQGYGSNPYVTATGQAKISGTNMPLVGLIPSSATAFQVYGIKNDGAWANSSENYSDYSIEEYRIVEF